MQAMRTPTVSTNNLQQRQSLQAAVRLTNSTQQRVECQASRRDLIHTAYTAATLLVAGQVLPALADVEQDVQEAQAVASVAPAEVASCSASSQAVSTGAKQVYFDVKVEGERVGRIVVALLDDVKVGAQRFADLAEEKEGVGYRLSKFDGIFPTYLRNEGVKSLSYNAAGRSQIAGGDSVQDLESELASSSRRHDQPGLVSIVVREATERPIKERLVAMGGKLVTLKEQAGEAPNGTQFMITTGPTPELDATNLIVGKVVSGFDVLETLSNLPYARPRDSWYDKPYFELGKSMGDKRATVAEKRFNRPLKRVLVADAGLVN